MGNPFKKKKAASPKLPDPVKNDASAQAAAEAEAAALRAQQAAGQTNLTGGMSVVGETKKKTVLGA